MYVCTYLTIFWGYICTEKCAKPDKTTFWRHLRTSLFIKQHKNKEFFFHCEYAEVIVLTVSME